MTAYVLILVLASGYGDTPTATLRYGGSGGDLACVTRLAAELNRAHSRGERILQAECRRA
jgi:hypothetical protein